MSKTKTAINQAIEYVENILKNPSITDKDEKGRLFVLKSMLKSLLPTERQQIEDSWRDGYYKMGGETTTDYFTSKYESNG